MEVAFECRRHARAAAAEDSGFGRKMNDLLAERLKVDALPSPPPFQLNNLHLRGLAYQLCDECHFFFSEPFNADEEAS
ncbi:hypothetical protein ACIBW9_41905 [Streptomyces sp. NPDC049541]|uniref:hypothetical protein n=1 Tax=Streptomyces sp. NPDC049541 TaxID=3365594 RepID=UPI0037A321D8